MCRQLGWIQLPCTTSAHECFFTAHVSPFMIIREVTCVPLERYGTMKCSANAFFPFPFLSNIKKHWILLTVLMLHLQTCMDKHQVVGVLRQMEKFLKGQEMRFTEGLRIMKSKLATLQNSVSKMPQADQSAGEWTFTLFFRTITLKLLIQSVFGGGGRRTRFSYVQNLWLPDFWSKQRWVMSPALCVSQYSMMSVNLSPNQRNCNT